ncbi:hypothetical protein VP1G_04707 [Cytospora mali]|uniref:Uncharacterized protein n=1 Tax=Cytospora mali TaxID=578113 RepID=A0A194V0D8_CYTMA|nr:hypothetical protein VP1G_04707 [Valsa mali var. pyri (nom. inval.)]
MAALCGNPELIPSLMKHGNDLNATDNAGKTFLMYAASYLPDEIVRMVLQHMGPKPDLEVQDGKGWTALIWACFKGAPEVVRLLLDAGANIYHRVKDGRSALAMCFIHPLTPVPVIKILVEAGVPVETVNNDGDTPLFVTLKRGNIKIFEYLMTIAEVRVNIGKLYYCTALHVAVESERTGLVGLVKTLIAAGADPNAIHPTSGESPLYTAIGIFPYSDEEQVKLLRYLVGELHIDVNAHGDEGKYPILRLVGQDDYGGNRELNLKFLKYLLRHGARIDVVDELGRGPAHYLAMTEADIDKIDVLIKAGADIQAKDKYGRTPLHFTAKSSSLDNLEYLLRRLSSGAADFDINVTDMDGWTPLMWACSRHWPHTPSMTEIVNLMVNEYGADIWARRDDGEWSPLKLARFHGAEFDLTELEPDDHNATRLGKDGEEEKWDPSFHEIGPHQDNKGTMSFCETFRDGEEIDEDMEEDISDGESEGEGSDETADEEPAEDASTEG